MKDGDLKKTMAYN